MYNEVSIFVFFFVALFTLCQDILKKAQSLSPRALVVDSIQTVYLKGIIGSAGGLVQVLNLPNLITLMRFEIYLGCFSCSVLHTSVGIVLKCHVS